ncbi:MAG: histidine phosphatase family protein [Spirochaetaceae bacterium]|nr:histidine phosphatase family protein [Spirochaetaceae bacterium]
MCKNLRNRFLLMRHGYSLANQEGLIISNPEEGIEHWGLASGADKGIRKSLDGWNLLNETIIFSSPFKRAVETARYTASHLLSGNIKIIPALRERFFGLYDKTKDDNYNRVWLDDIDNPDNHKNGVESPEEVSRRLIELIIETDRLYTGKTIILVSHGDPLNILLTYYSGMSVDRHRDIKSMKTAELRELLS